MANLNQFLIYIMYIVDIIMYEQNNVEIIPKVIFQTSITKQPQHVINMLKIQAPNWEYKHFIDNEIIQFFIANPLKEFPNIIYLFNKIKCGAHKADLFRYYYLYIYGGVFIDSDAMLEDNIENIVKNYDFFTVNSCYCPGNIFQGFIGATPKNPIIYAALLDMYNINIPHLNNTYLLVCTNLYNLLKQKWDCSIKIYPECFGDDTVALTKNDNNKIILTHYFGSKIVPKKFFSMEHFMYAKKIEEFKNNQYLGKNRNLITNILSLNLYKKK